MKRENVVLLGILGVFWGISFVFMSILAPIFGPLLATSFRMLIGGIFILIYLKIKGISLDIRGNLLNYIIIGLVNSALPFLLFSYGALFIDASVLVVINALAPVFGAIFSYFFLSKPLSYFKVFGLFLGVLGVVIINISTVSGGKEMILPLIACLLAPCAYGVGGVLINTRGKGINSDKLAFGTQFFAGLILTPLGLIGTNMKVDLIDWKIILILILYGVFSSGIAFLMYFKVLSEEGLTKALTVTFITPIFGVFWAIILLKESITVNFIIGAIIVLIGTYFVTHEKKKNIPR